MKDKTYRTLLLCAALMAVSACGNVDDNTDAAQGSLTLRISLNDMTKAAVTDREVLESAVIGIYKADFSGMVRRYTISSAPEAIYLPADEYRVDVEAGESVKENPRWACWDSKSYKGSSKVTVSGGETSLLRITAGISNAVTKVTFDPSVARKFNDGYRFTVGTDMDDASRCLTYGSGNSGREGYFLADGDETSLFWNFEGTLVSDGSTVTASGRIDDVQGGRLYAMKPKYTSTDGMLSFTVMLDCDVDVVENMIVFEPVSTGLTPSKRYEIWAGHATLHADVDGSEYEEGTGIEMQWSSDGEAWTGAAASKTADGTYECLAENLEPDTEYEYRLMIDGQETGSRLSFTTDAAPQLPNFGFETVSNAENKNWISFYDPSSDDLSARRKFWDSGSSASAGMLGASYAICYSDSDVPAGIGSKRSARLQSMYAVIKFAAGNIFTGEFAGLDGMNGKVDFGRPWTSRPSAVRFWYRYEGGKVDHEGPAGTVAKGEYDQCNIEVALGTWSNTVYGGTRDCPVQVNTSDKSTFRSYPDLPETIAYGQFTETGNGSRSAWRQVTVSLDYKSLTEFPTHIIVSCASSRYGDYFAGCSSSTLLLDNFELIYE